MNHLRASEIRSKVVSRQFCLAASSGGGNSLQVQENHYVLEICLKTKVYLESSEAELTYEFIMPFKTYRGITF